MRPHRHFAWNLASRPAHYRCSWTGKGEGEMGEGAHTALFTTRAFGQQPPYGLQGGDWTGA